MVLRRVEGCKQRVRELGVGAGERKGEKRVLTLMMGVGGLSMTQKFLNKLIWFQYMT